MSPPAGSCTVISMHSHDSDQHTAYICTVSKRSRSASGEKKETARDVKEKLCRSRLSDLGALLDRRRLDTSRESDWHTALIYTVPYYEDHALHLMRCRELVRDVEKKNLSSQAVCFFPLRDARRAS